MHRCSVYLCYVVDIAPLEISPMRPLYLTMLSNIEVHLCDIYRYSRIHVLK